MSNSTFQLIKEAFSISIYTPPSKSSLQAPEWAYIPQGVENSYKPSVLDEEDAPTPDTQTPDTPSPESPTPETPPTETPEIPPEEQSTPPQDPTAPPALEGEAKANSMFGDSGDPDKDYDLNNPNNLGLAVYKLKNAGIDVTKLISEENLKNGITTKDIETRLTPDQKDTYKKKNEEIRKKYKAIDEREKNIIIHNSKVPMLYEKDGVSQDVPKELKKEAYKKINDYLEAKFGTYWQDKDEAIKYLKEIKLNFSKQPYIVPYMKNARDVISLEEKEEFSSFAKLNTPIPQHIGKFIADNKENPSFSQSNIFKSLADIYLGQGGTGVHTVITSDMLEGGAQEETSEETPPETPEETPEGTPEETGEPDTIPEGTPPPDMGDITL